MTFTPRNISTIQFLVHSELGLTRRQKLAADYNDYFFITACLYITARPSEL